MDFTTLFEQFNHLQALVVGDVMLDSYLHGNVDRISPEAPVPVVHITHSEHRPGGASNVALNLAALGATAHIAGITGNDAAAETLRNVLQVNGIHTDALLADASRPTTVKNRVVSRNHQMLRYDVEQTGDIHADVEKALIESIKKLLDTGKVDVVILEDYNKGVLTENVITAIVNLCVERFIPTCVDPKSKNFFAYKNVTLFKPNLREIREALHTDIDTSDIQSLQNTSAALRKILHHNITLITLSDKGVYCDEGTAHYLLPAHIRNIADVSGAGDTVIATAALCLALNLDAKLMASISNIAGGLVCEIPGVAAIDKGVLLAEVNKLIK